MTATHSPTPDPTATKEAKYLPENVFELTKKLFFYQPKLFWANVILWGLAHTSPALFMWCVSQLFGALERQNMTAAWVMLAVYGLVRFLRVGIFYAAFQVFARIWMTLDALMRRNLLAYLLTASGARRLPDTPAEAVSRFRDDVDDVDSYVEAWIDSLGFLLFSAISIYLMARIDPLITLLVCLPLVLLIAVVQGFSGTIRAYRRRMREATARVTDFIGETFGAVTAIKLAGREPQMVQHLRELGETRRKAALRDVLLTQLISGINTNMVNLAVGLVLLLGANLVIGGKMQVADFVLFIGLLPRLTVGMGFFGDMIARHRRTGVSYERMNRLLVDAPTDATVQHHPLPLGMQEQPEITPAQYLPPHYQMPAYQSLQQLELRDLSATHPSGLGVRHVNLSIQKGQFVVITGRVGSGKTTLLRALLGLIPKDSGLVLWNGQEVTDPARFFVPPHSAYTAQVPNLFSDSLRANVLTGNADDRHLQQALSLAVLTQDLKELHQGLETPVGTRGVKLSGGQVQRAAVARMLSRQADLLVFDDVSSALDARTEAELWDGLARELQATCLVVSHRRAALSRANHIVVLVEGQVSDCGSLAELLKRSPEMRALWADDSETQD